ncbi:Nif11 family protein [Schleiferilactobacillus harbinensis]|uniref:Nif11 family protein n=1 Tax=Schleiferilactobacillus harbinensis TaxID=304207 RepID=UPI0007B9EA45|nr:Nif11-like leader peptide family natural product precursor [Schleiferilactobacillus harbinensis]
MSKDRAKALIPDWTTDKIRQAIRESSPEELADLAQAFGYDFDTEAYRASLNSGISKKTTKH